MLAERAGLRIHEVPVDWIDDPDSRVAIIATALADLRGIVRLGTGLARGTIRVPVLRGPAPRACGLAGAAGRLRAAGQPAGAVRRGRGGQHRGLRSAVSAAPAGCWRRRPRTPLSLLITAVANTAANRRLTFGIRGRAHAARHQLRGLIAFGIGLAVTSGALAALHAVTARPGRAAEVAVLVAANLVATVVRFALYRSWVFRGPAAALAAAIPAPDRPTGDSRCPASSDRIGARVTAISRTRRARRRAAAAAWPGCCAAGRTTRRGPGPRCWPCSLATALLYLVGLSRNGWANEFYAAAVQAGHQELEGVPVRLAGLRPTSSPWTSPPASCGSMELSARIFGVNYWSLLVPQALEGVATVGVLYATVRRWFGPAAGIIAGAVMALTPVATLMFRFNNPDALLTLMMTLAAYASIRALESGRTRWVALTGVLLGLGFLGKMLAGVPGAARLGAGLPGAPGRPGSASGSGSCWPAAPRCWSPRAGGWRSSC